MKKFDPILFFTVLALVAFGVVTVYEASVVEAFSQFSDKFYFAKLQLRWAGLGLAVMLLTAFIPYKIWQKLSLPLFIASLLLLIAVLIPGVGSQVQGARRWLNFSGITLQPSELVKLTFVMYLASWFTKRPPLLPFLLLSAILLILIMLQPDLGTAVIIIGTGFLVYFLSGAPLLAIAGIGIFGLIIGLVLIVSSSYRRVRLLTFFNPTTDPLGASYHIRQILIALGSGGLFGLGLGQSRQKYSYLPEATTDSIFAIIGEEIGFAGAGVIIGLFLLIIYCGFSLSLKTTDRFGQLLGGGIIGSLALQVFINLAAMVALVPLTGVPLPLISYGGSSLITHLAGIGILLNISRSGPKLTKNP